MLHTLVRSLVLRLAKRGDGMSVNKTAQGTWRARIRDHTGRQIVKTFRMKADALVWEREQLILREQGGGKAARSQDTVSQWAYNWLAMSRHLAPGGKATYERDLERYILPDIGRIRLSDLTADDIDRVLSSHLDRGLAPSTVHRHYRTMRTMLEVAVTRGHLTANPARTVKPPRIPPREMLFLSIGELEQLASTIGDRYRSWVLTAGWAGLRWAELLALRPQDIKDGVIDVNAQLVVEGRGHQRVPPKSKASRRRVTLPPTVARELDYHIDRYPGAFVFTNANGEPINHASFSGNHWKPALVKAGLNRQLRIHDLRHTAVAIAIQAGAHPKTIQSRLGHASISITLDTYGHLMPEMESSLAFDLDDLRQAELGGA